MFILHNAKHWLNLNDKQDRSLLAFWGTPRNSIAFFRQEIKSAGD
jgi:hypothetical protein